MTDPHIPEDLARSLAYESLRRAERTESGGFSDREEEEFLLHYGPEVGTQGHQGTPEGA